ncbi:MAG: hypothetical protein RLO01_00995 [Thalassobaculaceae bacterium]
MYRVFLFAGFLALALIAADGVRSVASADESSARDLLALAREAEDRGDNRAAVDFYKRAHEAAPVESAPLIRWGRLAARLGAVDQAATLLGAALDAEPGNAAASEALADVMVELDLPAEALALYDAVLEADPSNLAAKDGRLFALALLADPTQAALPATVAEVHPEPTRATLDALARSPITPVALTEALAIEGTARPATASR